MTEATISELFIFPVKSLRGVSVREATATASGLEGDRQWGVINSDGILQTQRKNPKMACIGANLTPSGLALACKETGEVDVATPAVDSPSIELKVWQDHCSGQLADENVNKWLTETLKSREKLRLVRLSSTKERRFSKPERFNIRGQFLSDAAPYLLANQASLIALNERLTSQGNDTVDIRHFRANIVISGPEAFTEHRYERVTEAEEHFALRLVDHCQRCSMITVDPDRGEFLPKSIPFKTLSEINNMPGKPKAPAFGVNSTLTNSGAVSIKVGQKLILS